MTSRERVDKHVSGEVGSLLRMPAIDGDKQRGLALVVGRWLDRANWVLERFEEEPMGERLAAELLVTWQALARMADDMPDGEERAALYASLEEVVRARSGEFAALAQGAFDLEAWRAGLRGYVARVGVSPSAWGDEEQQYAVMLIEGLDDALLCEAALEVLGVVPTEAFASALQAASVEGAQAASSLVPAYGLIQAGAWSLDPQMCAAPGSYPLWLSLVEAYFAWDISDIFAQIGARAMRE